MIDQNSPTGGGGPEPRRRDWLERGAAIGPYVILEKIGEGGFGTVYSAEQREPVRRRVALKVVKPGMDSAEVIGRFEAERQALALMDHPGVAKVLDAGMTADGRPYFVMEYVQGVPITEYCDQNRLTMPQRLELFMHVCHAVQHAHQKGIIHRDLKPSNLLVTKVDGKPSPKVIDFGIAKAMGRRLTDDTVYTEVGRLIGTLEYMSPEQAAGGIDVDTRTDTYALGVVLYQLLTGALPFESGALRKAGFAGLQRIICEVDPPKPSTKLMEAPTAEHPSAEDVAKHRGTDATGLRRQIRGDLDWIVMKALDKDRARRYDSPVALALDLERHLNNEPVSAGPPSAGYRIGKFLRRHRFGAAAAAVILALLVGGLAASLTLWSRAEVQRKRAEHEEANAREAYGKADAQRRIAEREMENAKAAMHRAEDAQKVSDQEMAKVKAAYTFVNDMFGAVDPAAAKGRDVTVREVLDTAAGRAADALKGQPEVEGEVQHAMGDAYYHIGRYAQSETSLKRALEVRERALGPEHADTLSTVQDLAATVLAEDRNEEAVKLARRAAEGREKTLGKGHKDTLASKSFLAYAVQVAGDLPGAEKLIREVVADQTASLGKSHRDTIESRSSLADVLQDLGKLDEAASVASELVTDSAAALGEDDTLTIQARSIYASILGSLGRDAEAEPVIRAVVEAKKRIYGPDHPLTLVSVNVLAQQLQNLDRLAEAEPLRRDLLARATKALGAEHASTLIYENNLAQVLRNEGKLDEAEPLYRHVLQARMKTQGPEGRDTLSSMVNLGILLQQRKQPEEGLAMLQGALAGLTKTMPGHWMASATRTYVGDCLTDLARYEEAEAMIGQGYGELVKALGAGHTRTKKAAQYAARLFAAWGKPDKAAEWEAKTKAP